MKGMIPAFVKAPDHTIGILGRKCTSDYKIQPIQKKMRSLVKIPRNCSEPLITQWIGISTDEAHRMKPAQKLWLKSRWPLIEMGFTRQHCLAWMKTHGYPVLPRSACVYCPFHSNKEWLRLKLDEPEAFNAAVEFEKRMQFSATQQVALKGSPFLHRNCMNLDEINFGSMVDTTMDMFGNECEGMCGV